MGEIQTIIDQWFVDIKSELTHVQDSMSQVLCQLVELMHKNIDLQREGYHAPTQFTKMQCPLGELVQLKQTGSLSNYQEQFKKISSRADLSEA